MAVDPKLYAELLPLLDSPRKEGETVLSYCPVHNDGAKHGRDQNGRGGRSLQLHPAKGLRCASHACDFKLILEALRAKKGPEATKPPARPSGENNLRQPSRSGKPAGTPAKNTYEYREPNSGELVAVKARYEWPDANRPKGYDKSMSWRLPNGTYEQGLNGLGMADMPLFRGERLGVADPDARIWWVEGEEAVFALERANEIAITSGGGSSGTTFNKDQLAILGDRDVVIWPDNDDAGRKYAHIIREHLRETARRVVIWEPKGTKSSDDAVDFFIAHRSIEEFTWPKPDELGEYEVGVDKSVVAVRPVGVFQITFRAVGVRKERTGIHATVTLRIRSGVLAFSNFNVERDEDRVRLANSAHKQLPEPLAQVYAASELKRDLDRFCAGLWDALAGAYDLGLMEGVPDAGAPLMVLDRFVIEGGGTILFGAPGKGKSTMGLLMAQSIATGSSAMWRVFRPQPVLYINLERSRESMTSRLGRANQALGLEGRTPLHFLNARGKNLAEVADAVSKYCRKNGIEMAILDSISRAGSGDLTENATGNRVIDMLNSLFKTWVAIGHTPREDDTHLYGTQMFDAGADVMVQLVSQALSDGRMGIGLQITKANDVPKGKQEVWSLEHDDGGLVAVSAGREGEFVEVEDRADRPTDEKIAIALSGGALTFDEISNRTGLGFEAVKKHIYRHESRYVKVDSRGKGVHAATWGLAARDTSLAPPERPQAKPTSGFACSQCGEEADRYTDIGQPICVVCEPVAAAARIAL